MYKKGAGNDKQRKDAGNRTLCPYRNFSQAIMKSIHLLHTAVQGNNYELRIEGWRRLFNVKKNGIKTNYARYGAYYMLQLQNLDITHPGCKELVKRNSISVQGQDKYPLRH